MKIFDYSNKKVLIMEFNVCHGECLPGYIKYFLDLGYSVDVWINSWVNEKEDPVNFLFSNNSRVNIKFLSPFKMFFLYKTIDLKLYDIVCFNSNQIHILYTTIKIPLRADRQNRKTLLVEHLQEYIPNKVPIDVNYIVLKQFQKKQSVIEVNPHWFGRYPLHNKNKKTEFVIVGNIETSRKNYFLLLKVLQNLLDNKITNFHATIIGMGKIRLGKILPALKEYITFTGRIKYKEMYERVSKSDFLLTLLDPENPSHKRYLSRGTSGSFQLVYGFNIPCVIESTFAKCYAFSDNNALIYNGNCNFTKILQIAIQMNNEKYQELKNELRKKSGDIYNSSLTNLQKVIAEQ